MTRPIRLLALAALSLACVPALAEKRALVVGVESVEDRIQFSPFDGADNDARKIMRAFIEALGVPVNNVTLLVSDGDPKPTRAKLLEALLQLASDAKSGDDLLIFWAGHGATLDGKRFLVPFDVRGKSASAFRETALEFKKFETILQDSEARSVTVFLDMGQRGASCRIIGPAKKPPRFDDFRLVSRPDRPPAPLTTFLAAADGQPSFCDDRSDRGFFSLLLERGLRGEAIDGEGHITVSALKRYIESNLPVETKRSIGVAQNPTVMYFGNNAEITLKESLKESKS